MDHTDSTYVMAPNPTYTQITPPTPTTVPANVSNELKSVVYEFEFQYTDNPRWLRSDVSVGAAFAAMQTGLLSNKPISRIKLFTISEGTSSVSFIYDIVAAKQGNSPWSLLPY